MSTSADSVMRPAVWMPMILHLVFSSGSGNSIFLLILPGLIKAGFNPVGVHDDLRIPSGVKPIQLVEKLQHSSLNLPLPTTVAVIPLGPHSINLVNENEAGAVLVSNPGWMNTLAILQTDIGMTYLLMQPTSSPEQHS